MLEHFRLIKRDPTAALALVRCLNRVKFLTFMRNLIETFHSERRKARVHPQIETENKMSEQK